MRLRCVCAVLMCSAGAISIFGQHHFVPNLGSQPPRYRIVIRDDPLRARFALEFVSLDDRTLCLSYRAWPNALGTVEGGSQWVKLKSSKGILRPRDWINSTCDGDDCTIRVPPNGTLTGFIGYAEFGDSKKVAALPNRRLEFAPLPHICGAN